MSSVSCMDVSSSVVYFYPRLIPLHNASSQEQGVPDQIRCTIEKVRDDGVYLLENGIHVLLFVGLATDPAWIQVRDSRGLRCSKNYFCSPGCFWCCYCSPDRYRQN